ncbi:MAG: hypothetical protein H6834_14125 [Planctomycetes bacterium]|nr:hypothetical protein [Planctomycetota bacterium]
MSIKTLFACACLVGGLGVEAFAQDRPATGKPAFDREFSAVGTLESEHAVLPEGLSLSAVERPEPVAVDEDELRARVEAMYRGEVHHGNPRPLRAGAGFDGGSTPVGASRESGEGAAATRAPEEGDASSIWGGVLLALVGGGAFGFIAWRKKNS